MNFDVYAYKIESRKLSFFSVPMAEDGPYRVTSKLYEITAFGYALQLIVRCGR